MSTKKGMSVGKPIKSPRRRLSSSSSTDDADLAEDDVDYVNSTYNASSILSSSESTDKSGYTLNVDVEGDGSPTLVRKPKSEKKTLKETSKVSCVYNSAEDFREKDITHKHTQTLKRRPLHGRGFDQDSYIEYTTECTVTSKAPAESSNGKYYTVIGISIICAVVFMSYIFMQSPGKRSRGTAIQSNITQDMYLELFNNVRQSFPTQTSGFWGILRAGIRPIIMQKEPDQPTVFIVVIPRDAVETANCLTRKLANVFSEALKAEVPVEFQVSDYTHLTPERVKRHLDDSLANGLRFGSLFAVIDHLEQLHGESAMMLHAYCDNDNAPYRHTIFILSFYVDEASSSVAETEHFVEERLEVLWKDVLGANRFSPLITRIAHSIVFVRPETPDTLEQNGC